MKTRAILAPVLAALYLAACAPKEFAFNPPLTRQQFEAFTPGVTTPEDAKAKLGPALKRSYDRKGDLTLTWFGGVKGRQYQEISIRFGPDGKMTEEGHAYMEMGDETRGEAVETTTTRRQAW